MKMRTCFRLLSVCAVALSAWLNAPCAKSDDIQTVLKVDGMSKVEQFTFVLFDADSTVVKPLAKVSGDTLNLTSLETGKSYILVLGTLDELYAPTPEITEIKGKNYAVRAIQYFPRKLAEISNRLATVPFTVPSQSQLESDSTASKTSAYIYTLPDVKLSK